MHDAHGVECISQTTDRMAAQETFFTVCHSQSYKFLAACLSHNRRSGIGTQGKNGSNQCFDFIKDFKSSVISLCD